jgi:autotransporter-associated beta strand protein
VNTFSDGVLNSAGTLVIGGAGQWNSGNFAGAITNDATLIYNSTAAQTLGGVISGPGALMQNGPGTLTLTAANTYSGGTIINAGTLVLTNAGSIAASTNLNLSNGAVLDVSGLAGGLMTLGSGNTISGDGLVKGNVTVAGGATLAPGNHDLGGLAFSNALTLNAGAKAIFNVSHNFHTNNVVRVAGGLVWGGALVISNADAPLQSGDTFTLFSAPAWTGGFSSLALPALTPGLYWNTNLFKTSATLSVATETPPTIGGVGTAGGNLVMTGSGGNPNGSYYVLTSTNLTAPLTNWTRLLTNQFDGAGDFNFTNPPPTNSPGFYLLQLP